MDTLSTSIWQDFFGVSNETAFIALVPLLIFILGLLLRWTSNKIKIRKENKQKREFIFSQVGVLINAVSAQRTSIKKFIELLKVDKIQNLSLEFKISFNPKHINQMGSNELFKTLVLSFWRDKKKRLAIFNSLIKQLDLIEGLKNEIKNAFEYNVNLSAEYEKKWNLNIKIIRELHDTWKIEGLRELKKPNEDNFLYSFNQFYLRYVSTKDFKDMYVAVPNFIEPTLQLARTQSPNVYAQKIIGYLLECLEAYDNHRYLKRFKMEEFGDYITLFNDVETELNNFLMFYKYKISIPTQQLNNQDKLK